MDMVDRQSPDGSSSVEESPLYKRLHRGSVATYLAHGPAGAAIEPAIATLQLLDGTLVARLSCDAECGVVGIGRASTSDVRISDPYVHRFHAEIRWDTETHSHILSHCGGENGSWVNLQRVKAPARLTDGARIRVGRTELIYRRLRS